jgi:DNA-binding LytR/AlgR family response regulator
MRPLRFWKSRNDIHLVFTDIDMPGSMDGLKLAACVRDRRPPVHILITTGKARPEVIPANALFISKPYLVDAVVAAIRTFENMQRMARTEAFILAWPP